MWLQLSETFLCHLKECCGLSTMMYFYYHVLLLNQCETWNSKNQVQKQVTSSKWPGPSMLATLCLLRMWLHNKFLSCAKQKFVDSFSFDIKPSWSANIEACILYQQIKSNSSRHQLLLMWHFQHSAVGTAKNVTQRKTAV